MRASLRFCRFGILPILRDGTLAAFEPDPSDVASTRRINNRGGKPRDGEHMSKRVTTKRRPRREARDQTAISATRPRSIQASIAAEKNTTQLPATGRPGCLRCGKANPKDHARGGLRGRLGKRFDAAPTQPITAKLELKLDRAVSGC